MQHLLAAAAASVAAVTQIGASIAVVVDQSAHRSELAISVDSLALSMGVHDRNIANGRHFASTFDL